MDYLAAAIVGAAAFGAVRLIVDGLWYSRGRSRR